MNNNYMSEYMRLRRESRRRKLQDMLGGLCADCGTLDDLQFDHVDPATKAFTISGGLDKPWKVLLAEALKCQLLCLLCHLKKTKAEGSLGTVPHGGGISGKKNCRCAPCRHKKSTYNKLYRERESR